MKRTLRPRVAALGLADVLLGTLGTRSAVAPIALGDQNKRAIRRHNSSRQNIQSHQLSLAYPEQHATMAPVL